MREDQSRILHKPRSKARVLMQTTACKANINRRRQDNLEKSPSACPVMVQLQHPSSTQTCKQSTALKAKASELKLLLRYICIRNELPRQHA